MIGPTSPHRGWKIERSTGSADGFHHRPLPHPLHPTVWIHRAATPALVLGSTQQIDMIDTDAARSAGYEVCKRRSGGGLVVIDPAESLWVDIVIPRGHHLWSDDIGKAFHWVGNAWAQALGAADPAVTPQMHTGPAIDADLGRFLCFAGLGHGEICIDGHKVVGLSQRRTRDASRIQGLALTGWDPSTVDRFVRREYRPANLATHEDLAPLKIGYPFDTARVLEHFLDALPDG